MSQTSLRRGSDSQGGLRIVIKVGSSSLKSSDGSLALSAMARLVETVVTLQRKGHSVVIVTSGSVALGCERLGVTERPTDLASRQALAAVGQVFLMRMYTDLFGQLNQHVAQILLTKQDLGSKSQYTNALNTLNELIKRGVVPIVNENDTVAVDELRFGDNDTLSALVSALVQADWLFLLTDVDSLYDKNPSEPGAKPIHVVDNIEEVEKNIQIGSSGTSWGTGGMSTKIQAARIATAAGVPTVIMRCTPENILDFVSMDAKEDANNTGTLFRPKVQTYRPRKRWIALGLIPVGRIHLDMGATEAVKAKKSLFAAGVARVEGDFPGTSATTLVGSDGTDVARGLVNYSSEEIRSLIGQKSEDIPKILGYSGPEAIIDRDNLVVI